MIFSFVDEKYVLFDDQTLGVRGSCLVFAYKKRHELCYYASALSIEVQFWLKMKSLFSFVECTIHGEERTKENEFCKSAEFVHIREAHS